MLEKTHLVKLANTQMPYGKYKGKAIIDLPAPYLVWFAKQGFPEDEIGMLMRLALEIDREGLRGLVQVLKK